MNTKPVAERACDGEPVVRVSGAFYVRGGYRSFEFADLSVRAGEVVALLGGEARAPRDLLLAIAGAVRPTSGSVTAPKAVGLGVFSDVADVDGTSTVEEAVARELQGPDAADVLAYLARYNLATHADQRVDRLDAGARARLSIALAFAGGPEAAVVDLRDPFCYGLTAADEAEVVRELCCVARAAETAVVVACAEPASCEAADAAIPLDIAAAEALSHEPVLEGADA